jgi:hypothetical protein
MPVTPQQKYDILRESGIDPDKYWIDDSGNVIDLPKDNSAMAGIKTAALNLPRTAAGVGGAALGTAGAGALGLPSGPGALATGIAGGFAGAALGSTLGEAFQNAVYPDDVLMAQQARSVRNPGAVQLGDLAATSVFFRPSISQTRDLGRAIRTLSTTPSFSKLRPAQTAAGFNTLLGAGLGGGSTMAEGGDLSEVLKNAAIGAVFSNPTKVSQVMTRGVFKPHVADVGLRDAVNPADLLAKPTEPTVEKPREVNPELLKAFVKQQQTDAKLAQQLAALKANQEAAAKKAQIDAEQGIGTEQPLPAQDYVLPPNPDSFEARFLRSQAVEPNVEITLDPQAKSQPKPPVIVEPGTPGALDQELGIRTTKPFFDWWAQNAAENYRTRMTAGRPTGDQGQSVAGVTQGTRGPDGKRDITVDKDAYTDTAPHELTHGMILDVLQHGKKGEQAEMRRLLKAAGVDEEAFVQGVGEDVVRRFMDKTDDSWRSDFVSFMKYKFGKASPEDVRRIMSNTMLRGGGSKGVSRIVAKPTQEVEEKPPVMPEPPRQEVNAEEMARTYQPVEQEAAPGNEEFNRSMQETRDRMRVEEMNRQNAQKVEGVRGEPVEAPVRRPAPVVEPAPVEPIMREKPPVTETQAQEADPPIDLAQPRSAELVNQPQPNRPVGSARRGAERVAAKEFSKLKREVRNIEPAELTDVDRPVSRTYSGESIPANVRRGRANATNERESAADLEARRIEAELAGEERPRYQEKGEEDRPLKFRQTEGPFKDEVIVTKSAKEPGRWQATHMADQGDGTFEPSGHATFNTRDEAIRSAQGENINGPAAGSRTFKLVDGTRYQQFGPNRPTSGLPDAEGRLSASPFESASQKAARSSNPVMRTVGRALTELFPAQRAMRGKYRALVESFQNLDTKDKDLLYKILIDEYRAGKTAPGTVPARLRKEYNDVRKTLRQMRDDQIAAGQRNANGAVPGIDDSYFPNVVDPSVRKTIVDEIDSPRFKQLKKEFVDFNQAHLVNNKGLTSAKAAEEANKLFNRFIGTLNKQPVEGAFDFGAVVLPEGSRLPDNWLHSDPAEAMSQYVRDWARSRTFHDIVQTNEDVMAGLGQEEFFVGGKKTPVKNRVASPVVKDNNILHLLNEAVGIRRGSQDKITGAVGRAASAAWLANPITRSVDIATSLFKGLGMVTPAQIPGLVSNLRNIGKSYERAHDTGWIREDGNTVIGEVLGAGEAFSNGVDKFSKGLSKYTGSEKLENFGRGLSQNIGEYIARTNVVLAQSGNKRSTDFLDRVAPNWRTLSEAELGTRIGQLFQGKYDATNLPQWLSDSPAAPFFSLARWNIEQWNNFREFAIKPARNGDPVPLISMLVAGLAGGVGIKEIREALSGRKSKIATLKEISEAPEGSAKYKELVRYVGNLAQLSGTIGIVGELGVMALDAASKDRPAAPTMPALQITSDIIPRLIAAGNAMMDGQDPLIVMAQVSRDIGNEHVSAYRFLEGMAARTGVSDFAKAELDAANDRRDFRVGKRMRDEPIRAAVEVPINYDNAEERWMEGERDPVKRMQLARELKAKIKQDPDKDSRERKMRAAAASRPSYLPSKENDPKAFREQLDFVRRTQGEDKATELKKRYLRDKKNSDSQRKIFNR